MDEERICGVPLSSIVSFLKEGRDESSNVAARNSLNGEDPYKFANRMTVRLTAAINRIEQLEERAFEDSWAGEVDRSFFR